jgi:hypothetical protein
MAKIEDRLSSKIDSIPKDRTTVLVKLFKKGQNKDTIFAVLFMVMIQKMVVVSLIPTYPLMITAGLGYFGIPLKPSTILVFSIAFDFCR